MLARRGARVVDHSGVAPAVVTFTCSNTLRERLCAAEVHRGDQSEVVSVQRVHSAAGDAPPAAPLVLELRPLVAQATPILDSAVTGTHLLVVDPSSVTRYQRTIHGWRADGSRPTALRRAWPRDVRGRLVVEATTFGAFLPGAACRGTIDPFELACSEEQRPWPIGFDNTGMAPARNYFISSVGRSFYAMAPLGADAGARWLEAAQDGRMHFLDDAQQPLEAVTGFGDDVVTLATPCAAGSHVLLPARPASQGDDDTLRLFQVVRRRLVPATPSVGLPGLLTAMWPTFDASVATVVSRNSMTGRYEAFQVGVSCGR